VWFSSASDSIKDALGIDPSDDTRPNTFTFDLDKVRTQQDSMVAYLSGKSLSITLDGTTKSIQGPTQEEVDNASGTTDEEKYINALQKKINDAFNFTTGNEKLTVSNQSGGSGLALHFTATDAGSSLKVTGSAFGIEGSLTNYVDTSNTLGNLIDFTATDASGQPLYETKKDENGNDAVDTDGNVIYTLNVNDTTFEVTEKTTLESLLKQISNSDTADVSATYSKTIQSFSFTAKDTGTAGEVKFEGALAEALFGKTVTADEAAANGGEANYIAGQNAKFTATVNGKTLELERSSNTVDIDNLSIKLKGEFDAGTSTQDAVTFTVSTDSDKIVDAVKKMITDYNSMLSSIKSAYTTYPAQKSDGSSYEPLSEDDKADMSDTAIANYEEKAKQGLLFMDSDLSALYSGLRNAFNLSGLKSIGITTSYSDGATVVSLDESTLRQALEDDPDKVKELFTSSTSSGGSYDGLMTKLSVQLKRYASTTGATKGILIEKAGSSLASTTLTTNTWTKAISSLEEQIEKWQDKLSV
jgi:flagellar hook-associated protein 2